MINKFVLATVLALTFSSGAYAAKEADSSTGTGTEAATGDMAGTAEKGKMKAKDAMEKKMKEAEHGMKHKMKEGKSKMPRSGTGESASDRSPEE